MPLRNEKKKKLTEHCIETKKTKERYQARRFGGGVGDSPGSWTPVVLSGNNHRTPLTLLAMMIGWRDTDDGATKKRSTSESRATHPIPVQERNS